MTSGTPFFDKLYTTSAPARLGFWRRLAAACILIVVGVLSGAACALSIAAVPTAFIGVMALLYLWVMPESKTVPIYVAKFMLPAFVFSIICVPVYFAIIVPGLPWISVRRLVLVCFLLPTVISIAGSHRLRSTVLSRFMVSPVIAFSFAGFFASVFVSTLFSIRVGQTLSSDFTLISNCLLPLVAVLALVRSQGSVERLFKVIISCAACSLVAGSIEFVRRQPFLIYVLPPSMRAQIIASNPLASALISGQGIRGGLYRASATFSNALTWGEASAMFMPLCLHFIAYPTSRYDKVFGYFGAILCFSSVVLSGSRGAYVGIITACVVYSMAWSARASSDHPERLGGKIWIVLYTMATAATLFIVLFVGRVHKIVLGGGEAQSSTEGRYIEWALAKPKILARPLWGYGGGTANDVIGYSPAGDGVNTIDGYHMNLLVDYGIPGFVFFTLLFVSAAFLCFRLFFTSARGQSHCAAAIGASIVAFMVYRLTLSQIDNLPLAYLLIALTLICLKESDLRTKRFGRDPQRTAEMRGGKVGVLRR